jgi:hypothetical protein
VDWIRLAQDRDQKVALLSAIMNLRVPKNARKFMSACTACGFSSGAQLYIYTHTHTHIHIYIHIHTYIHTPCWVGSLSPQNGAFSGYGWRNGLPLWKVAAANILNK